MRKVLSFILVTMLVAAFGVSFAAAQEEMPTIAEVVVAQTQADPSEFNVLLAAVSAADPAILETLSAPVENNGYTVFAPTDAAFAAAFEALGMTAEDVLANPSLLNTLLLYHVVPAVLPASAVTALEGEVYVGTLLPDSPLKITVSESGVMVNDSNVVATDVMASNGVIHVIDAVLVPANVMDIVAAMDEAAMAEPMEAGDESTIAELAASNADLSTLVTAVGAITDTNVTSLLTDPNSSVTVFAPTNDAFAALPEGTVEGLLADPAALAGVVGYHVVPGEFSAASIAELGGMVEGGEFQLLTAVGTPVNVAVSDEGVTLNGAPVVATDIDAAGGTVHVMGGVILPPM